MESTVCEEHIRQAYHVNICPSQFDLTESWKLQPVIAESTDSPLELSKIPTNPLSLKGVSRFKHYENMLDIILTLKRGGNPRIQSKSISKFRALQEVMEILFCKFYIYCDRVSLLF